MKIASYGLPLVCGFGIAAACVGLQAQQVSPVVSEFNKKARGAVQIVTSATLRSLSSCRAQGFDPDEHGGRAASSAGSHAERAHRLRAGAPGAARFKTDFLRCDSGCTANLVPGDMSVHASAAKPRD